MSHTMSKEAPYISPQKRSLYNKWEMKAVLQTSYEEGLKFGLEIGLEKGIEKIIIRCLKQGKPIEEISEITGLSIEQVKQIQSRMV